MITWSTSGNHLLWCALHAVKLYNIPGLSWSFTEFQHMYNSSKPLCCLWSIITTTQAKYLGVICGCIDRNLHQSHITCFLLMSSRYLWALYWPFSSVKNQRIWPFLANNVLKCLTRIMFITFFHAVCLFIVFIFLLSTFYIFLPFSCSLPTYLNIWLPWPYLSQALKILLNNLFCPSVSAFSSSTFSFFGCDVFIPWGHTWLHYYQALLPLRDFWGPWILPHVLLVNCPWHITWSHCQSFLK